MPIDRLSASDLIAFPVWEFAIDEEEVEGRDETWVRPVDAKVLRAGLRSLSVAAEFRTHAGVAIPGFIGVTTARGIEIDNGVLLPEGRYVFVDVTSVASRKATAKALGMSVKNLFPLAYTLRVRIGGEKTFRAGLIQ